MAKNFLDLHNARSAEAKARVKARVQRALAEMPIQELQQARHLSQEQLANILFMEPATLSQLERGTDIYISTLRSYIEAMGGKLDIIANFPDGEVRIKLFTDIKEMHSNSDTVCVA
ncbi:transcriptional regulator [Candidatus Thiomargarita nelsonii]|uniref:Transcriptional regulator n=1 Tax=Candidatus Thiomargarita nelsonii TaxID=1003181 RepID=A0A4E0QLT6_9GAMM|nr:transcriptional regulator [Candidatus Thiomargarita nelsonii]